MTTVIRALTILCASAGTMLVPAAVRAQGAVTACTGTDTTTFDPGLRLFSRTSTTAWTDDYPICISSTPGIESASSPGGSYTTDQSCLDILSSDPADGSQRIDWSNGQYSIFSWAAEDVAIVTGLGNQVVTVNAVVTEGLYLGQPLIEVIAIASPALTACLFEPGLKEIEGPITLTVLP